MMRRIAVGAVGLAGIAAAAYSMLWRERCLTWGAHPEEVAREMPGDSLLPEAPIVTTRAISVAAPPSAIWPWLVQLGPGRGGAYTYDWIENLFGLNMHSVDEVLPELQDLAVGDSFPLGEKTRMRVAILDAESALVFQSGDGAWVWSFGLYPRGEDLTRLVSRNRIADTMAVSRYFMEPGSLVMERKMLLGIKERAERLHARAADGMPDRAGSGPLAAATTDSP